MENTIWRLKEPYASHHFSCVSADTECLTKAGWKTYDEIKPGAKVAAYDLKTHRVELQPVHSIKVYDFDGQLAHIGQNDLDILATGDHRHIVKDRAGNLKVKTTMELVWADRILVHAPLEWEENKGIGTDLASLIGWIISEGCYHSAIVIAQNRNQFEPEIDGLLSRVGIPYSKYERTSPSGKIALHWYLLKSKSPWVEKIKSICPTKKLNAFLVSLPKVEARALFDGIMKGDGWSPYEGYAVNTERDPEEKKWFQILAFRLGYYPRAGSKGVALREAEAIGSIRTSGKWASIHWVRYKGKVWCPVTPNGTWVAWRNGRVWITGNSVPERPLLSI